MPPGGGERAVYGKTFSADTTPVRYSAMTGHGLLAAGWVMMLAVLATSLSPAELVISLGTLAMAESAAVFLCTISFSLPHRQSASDLLTRLLGCWLLLCLAIGLFANFDDLPFFDRHPFAALCLPGLALVLSLLRLVGQLGPSLSVLLGALIAARWLVLSGLLATVTAYADLSSDVTLSLAVLLCLVLLGFSCWTLRGQQMADVLPLFPQSRCWHLMDLMILPLLLSGAEALAYLLARGAAQLPPGIIQRIESGSYPTLARHVAPDDPGGLIATAARLNLGLLLAGGGLSLAAVTLCRQLPEFLDLSDFVDQTVLVWLVLGASGPVIFGATDTILRALGQNGLRYGLQGLSVVLLAAFTLGSTRPDALSLAQGFAVAQLMPQLLASIWLIRCAGIWPGITAITLRRIRLL